MGIENRMSIPQPGPKPEGSPVTPKVTEGIPTNEAVVAQPGAMPEQDTVTDFQRPVVIARCETYAESLAAERAWYESRS